MSKYTIKFYGTKEKPLNYSERQAAANRDGADAYFEQHFNSVENKSANYALSVVGSNASKKSREMGADYARRVADAFKVPVYQGTGIAVGGVGGRGDGNIRNTNMPAVLLEPLFVSNPKHAAQVRTEGGRQLLAEILAQVIRKFYPHGGLIAFSIGHKFKRTKTADLGAPVHGGGMEADYAEDVLKRAEAILTKEK